MKNTKNIEEIEKNLKENGFSNLEPFLTKNKCFAIKKQIMDFIKDNNLKIGNYENYKVIDSKKIENVQNIKSPTIAIRGHHGYDTGMLDIFNASDLFDLIPKAEMVSKARKIIEDCGYSVSKCSQSVYYNDSIVDTATFHRDCPIDSNKVLFKLFTYVTNVSTLSYGPYCYIRGTHRKDISKNISNQLIGKTTHGQDIELRPEIFLGPPGTTFVSNQKGVHKGWEQKMGKVRIAIVTKIRG